MIPTDDYTPDAESLQTIVSKGQFMMTSSDMKLNAAAHEALVRMVTDMNVALSFAESIKVHSAYSNQLDKDYRSGLTVRFRLQDSDGNNYFLAEATGDNPAAWLDANAWKYGFVLRYPKGSALEGKEKGVDDVYRYVGVPHAYYITHVLELEESEAVPTLEDYVALAKNAKAKTPIVFEVKGIEDSGVYNVYYVAAADVDRAMIREDAELYSVDGVGDGYIVTTYIRTESADVENEDSSAEASEESTEENN